MSITGSRRPFFVAVALLIFALLPFAGSAGARAQSGSASGTFDTSNAAFGIVEVQENRITITRDGSSAQAEIIVKVVTELPGTIVGSVCRTEYTQRMTASGTVSPGQKVWPFSGTLVTDWVLLSGESAACSLAGHDHGEVPHSFTATINGAAMTGFVNGMAFTIADASAILDQPTPAPTPVPAATPTPTEVDFDDGEEFELLEKDCFLDPGLRPVIGVVTAVSGTVEVQRDVSGTYVPIDGGSADAPADPSLVAADSFVLRQGDVVRTGVGAAAKVLIFEKPIPVADLASQAGTPLSELGGNVTEIDELGDSLMCIRAGILDIPGLQDKTVLDLLKGVVRHLTKNWKNGSIFSTRAGTTVCGGRGTEFILAHWREEDETAVLLREGEVAIEAPEPELVMPEGSWTLVSGGAARDLWALDEEDWRSVLDANDPHAAIRALERAPLTEVSATSSHTATPPAASDPDEESDGGGSSAVLILAVVLGGVIVAGGGAAGLLYMRRSSRGDSRQ
jgi:hypothetical protein